MRSTCVQVLALVAVACAHSWIDSLTDLANSSNVGYIRSYQGHLDGVSSFQIQSKAPETVICRSNQLTPTYSTKFPMLAIRPNGGFMASYLENGHVTKDTLAPDNRPHPGNYSWFLARSGANVTPLRTYSDLYNKATIIATGNFDDGKCAEDNTRGRSQAPCKSYVSMTGIPDGVYQLVWLWQFPKVANVIEMYSSCADIRITSLDKVDSTETVFSTSTVRRSTTIQAPFAPEVSTSSTGQLERFITLTTTKTVNRPSSDATNRPDGSLANI